MNADWQNRYDLAIEAAKKAGQHALSYFDADVNVEWKKDDSPVTIADRQSEELLRKLILEKFPDDGFLGEEYGDTAGTSGYRWIIDPIDGTRSFVRGVPLWATLVGLEYQGESIIGVAEVPALKQTYRAMKGAGAYRDDRKIHVSDVDSLEKAHLYYSSFNWFLNAGKEGMFLDLIRETERQRGFGDFYGFVLVAQGAGDIMLEYGCHAWDLCALMAIVTEAGGKLTNWSNESTIYSHDVIATNGRLHETVLSKLTGKPVS